MPPAVDGEVAEAAARADVGGSMTAAFMKPLTDGVNSVLGKGETLDRVIDVVGDWVPLEKVKTTLKTTLQPQYQQACTSVSPQLEEFGGFAGVQVLEFMNVRRPRIMILVRAPGAEGRSVKRGSAHGEAPQVSASDGSSPRSNKRKVSTILQSCLCCRAARAAASVMCCFATVSGVLSEQCWVAVAEAVLVLACYRWWCMHHCTCQAYTCNAAHVCVCVCARALAF